jgi:hypothetical protein
MRLCCRVEDIGGLLLVVYCCFAVVVALLLMAQNFSKRYKVMCVLCVDFQPQNCH